MITRDKYVELVNSIRHGRCLKTDCWNEAENQHPIKADVYLEIDPWTVTRAQNKGYNVILGDITKMPFEDNDFDCIFDCSTIDHVANYEDVLKEYNRCLKDTGKILVIVWTTKELKTIHKQEQYWFNKNDFTTCFQKYFNIMDTDIVWNKPPEGILCYFIGNKNAVGISTN